MTTTTATVHVSAPTTESSAPAPMPKAKRSAPQAAESAAKGKGKGKGNPRIPARSAALDALGSLPSLTEGATLLSARVQTMRAEQRGVDLSAVDLMIAGFLSDDEHWARLGDIPGGLNLRNAIRAEFFRQGNTAATYRAAIKSHISK